MEERELIQFIKVCFPQEDKNILIPLGDDAAVYKPSLLQVATCDQLVENIHFCTDSNPKLVGRKLFARSLSDIAAMGAIPRYALFSLATNKSFQWLKELVQGIRDLSIEFKTSVIGGDCSSLKSSSDATVLSLTLIGQIEEELLVKNDNSLIREGDCLFVSGELGNSFHSGHHFSFLPKVNLARFLVKNKLIKAMTDLSDAILTKLDSFLLSNEGLSIKLFTDKIPFRKGANLCSALVEGEDYELIFVASPKNKQKILSLSELTFIGEFFLDSEKKIVDCNKNNLKKQYAEKIFRHKWG